MASPIPTTKNHDAVIAAINNEFHDRGVDFTFVNGDLFHNDVNFMEPVKQNGTLLLPHYVSHGNHDQNHRSQLVCNLWQPMVLL